MKTVEVNLNKLLEDLELKVGKKAVAKMLQRIQTGEELTTEPVKKKELQYKEEFHYITTCRFCGTTVDRITTYHSNTKETKKDFLLTVNRCNSCNKLLNKMPVQVLEQLILVLLDDDLPQVIDIVGKWKI